MNFENHDMRIIAPLDPVEGWIYIEPMKEEVVGGWDHAYNISEYYINPTADEKIVWWSSISASSKSYDALEN